jgi:hypothetical protein
LRVWIAGSATSERFFTRGRLGVSIDILGEHFNVDTSIFIHEVFENPGLVKIAALIEEQRQLLLSRPFAASHWHLQKPVMAALCFEGCSTPLVDPGFLRSATECPSQVQLHLEAETPCAKEQLAERLRRSATHLTQAFLSLYIQDAAHDL